VERSQRSVAIVWLQLALGISRLDAIRQCVTAFANPMMATAPIGAESCNSSRSAFATVARLASVGQSPLPFVDRRLNKTFYL
jgi:hypothetical protein